MTEPQTERTENPEVLQIKAQHQIARMEHEREMALFDEKSIGRMPLALRLMFDDRLRERVQRAAEEMSRAVGFTPQHLIGKTEACLVVVTRAITWNLDPYSVAMSTYQTPGGKVGYEGALVRAILEASGELRGTIKHSYYGDWNKLPRPSFMMKRGESGKMSAQPAWEYWSTIEVGLGVTISATLAATGEEMSLDFDLVDAYPRNATTWPTRPKIQLLNPAIRTFARQVRPSLLMGVHLRDDFSDAPEIRDVTPERAEPAPQQRDRMSVIAGLNTPPARSRGDAHADMAAALVKEGLGWDVNAPPLKESAIPQTAPERSMPLGTNQQAASTVPPQDVGYSVQPRREPIPKTAVGRPRAAPRAREELEAAPDGQVPAAPAGEPHRRPRRSPEQITTDMIARIMAAETQDQIEDELNLSEYARRSLQEKSRIDEAAQKRRLELLESQLAKTRPPEPAGEARQAEPGQAATPAPGREDDAPPWVTEETEIAPESGGRYALRDELGKVTQGVLNARNFLDMLTLMVKDATPDDVRRLKYHNERELRLLSETEGGELANDALDLLA